MNLSQLRTLIAVAEQHSFTAAAEALFITPAAVSHQMRELEESLGVELFDRTTRPPRLNAHAQAVVEKGREVLLSFEALVAVAKNPGEVAGHLILGCVSGFSSDLIPLALARLKTRHPAVQVRIEEGLSGQLANRVRRRELDAAIITELPEPDAEFKSLLITQEALMLVAPPGAVATDWQSLLTRYPFIRLNRTSGMGIMIDRVLQSARLTVTETMELDSSEAIVGMARAGLGAGVVPVGRLQYIPPGAVVCVPFGDPPLSRRVVLIERRNNQRSYLAQLVYEELRQLTPQHRLAQE